MKYTGKKLGPPTITYKNEIYVNANVFSETELTLTKENGETLILPREFWNELEIQIPHRTIE